MFSAKSLAYLLVGVCSVLCAVPASARDDEMHAHHHEATEQLGKVSFPHLVRAWFAEGLRAWHRSAPFLRV
jgi:hypothetical protein